MSRTTSITRLPSFTSLLLMTALVIVGTGCREDSTIRSSEAVSESSATETSSSRHIEPPPFYLGGIQINEADHQAWFDALIGEGMNSVQVTDYAKQGDWDTDHMWWDEEAPWVLEEIRGAKKRGLHVVLVLRVALDHAFERNAFLWHGMIMPKSEPLIASWFEQYTKFCLRWAEIAEREGVDVVMIGSEMNALASTLEVDELPPLEEYFLNEEKQVRRRAEVLEQKQLIEEKALYLRDKETFPTVEEYLEARIATEQAWAEQTAATTSAALTPPVEDSEAMTPEALARLEAERAKALVSINARRRLLLGHWQQLIVDIRQVYSGSLGYAANFDQYHEVGFWPQLDLMGINAYFKLRNKVLEGFDEAQLYPLLLDGWRTVLGDIASFRETQGIENMPLIFTEMGYTYRRRSTLEPWADTGFSVITEQLPESVEDAEPAEPANEVEPADEGEPVRHIIVWRDEPIEKRERALAVRALHQAHSEFDEPFLRGILYWKLGSHAYHEEVESFMVHIGPESDDPMLPELRRFLPAEE